MLTRDDLAVVCAELGAALTRIATRLSLSTSSTVQIVQPSPEPAAAAPVAPTAPVPATPQREAAVAGPEVSVVSLPTERAPRAPKPTLAEQIMAVAAEGPFTIGRALSRTGKPAQQCYNLVAQLCRAGKLDKSEYAPRVYALPGHVPTLPPLDLQRKPQRRPSMRNCLRCSKRFHSEGAHNRLCGTCSSAVSGLADAVGFSSGGRAGQVLS